MENSNVKGGRWKIEGIGGKAMPSRRAFLAAVLGAGVIAPTRALAAHAAQRKPAPSKLTTVTLAVSGMT
jgi:hypothetical protein